MKKLLLLAILFLFVSYAHAQKYDESEKEALREILRIEGHEMVPGPSGEEYRKNFEQFGLTEADTLAWYDSEEWLNKMESFEWNEDSPKRMIKMSIDKGLSGLHYDLSPFTELESLYCGIFISPITTRGCSFDISENKKLKTVSMHQSSFSPDSFQEENNIEKLVLVESPVPDLTKFPELKHFLGGGISTDFLDFSTNTLLTEINLINYNMRYSNLEDINVRNNKSLKSLSVANVRGLKVLDVSENSELEDLYINEVTLGEITFPATNKLKKLWLSSNLPQGDNKDVIKDLDLSTLDLDTLYIGTCYFLENIQIPDMTNLKRFECQSNFALSSLDVSGCINLEYLDCSSNSLTTLKTPDSGKLKTLACKGNVLKFSSLPLINCKDFDYSSQREDLQIVSWQDRINLSAEYIIDGYVTDYQWSLIDSDIEGRDVLYLSGNDGQFELTEDMAGKQLNCTMVNDRFPDLVVNRYYKIEEGELGIGAREMSNAPLRLQSSVIKRYESIVLESSSEKPGIAHLYNFMGQTVSEGINITTGINQLPSPISSGIYMLNVRMPEEKNYSFKILVR